MAQGNRAVARGRIGIVAALALIVAAGQLGIGSAWAQTLEQALSLAYLNNPVLRARRAGLRATDERVSQARSGWRPTVRLRGSVGHKITDNRQNVFAGTRTQETNPQIFGLEIRQPVFRGLRET